MQQTNQLPPGAIEARLDVADWEIQHRGTSRAGKLPSPVGPPGVVLGWSVTVVRVFPRGADRRTKPLQVGERGYS